LNALGVFPKRGGHAALRGDMEFRIKECQGDLFAARTLAATMCAK
jgi:hypothetical protein